MTEDLRSQQPRQVVKTLQAAYMKEDRAQLRARHHLRAVATRENHAPAGSAAKVARVDSIAKAAKVVLHLPAAAMREDHGPAPERLQASAANSAMIAPDVVMKLGRP
jgi:hypothetical protein